ncbi:hypothetical protein [Terribacillus sp. 7520-G]|uniref:hypothetical protein n=1 Tax=Terribacillus TaxID=459532 RepID=UPI000BA72CF1|nr:hypothetical protein [Terribacillus sp. 7520-G]PAD38264.1 hypothetical protein CHH53_12310 [Terribacillus sp. 7520-G]
MRCLSESEYKLGSRFLFLSMAIVVLQQDIRIVEEGKHKIKTYLLHNLQAMEKAALEERRKLRIQLRQRNMQIVTAEKNDAFTTFLFITKECEEKRNYFNPAIRKKVEAILMELTQKALLSDPRCTSTNA